MSYELEVKIQFRAGHRLLPPYEGKCNNPHGEGYTAIVILEQEQLDSRGMLMDFGDCKRQIKEWIDNNWDHSYICSMDDEIGLFLKDKGFRVYPLKTNPTAENMAKCLFNVIKEKLNFSVKKVGIIESFEDSIGWYKK